MIVDIIINYALQIGFTVGIIVLFGFLIALCNRQFYSNLGRRATLVCYITGFIGTPVHECAHALFCLIFCHRIDEIKLFQISSDDGTLGYVSHSYNKRNIYQRIGNFFIGVAPILVISALLFLISWLLMPDMLAVIREGNHTAQVTQDVTVLFTDLWFVVKTFFSYAVCWQWWVFLLIGMFLAPHMTLSGADIKGALGGIIFLLLATLVADFILALISVELLTGFTAAILHLAGYMLCFLVLALVITLIMLIISCIVRAVSRRRY